MRPMCCCGTRLGISGVHSPVQPSIPGDFWRHADPFRPVSWDSSVPRAEKVPFLLHIQLERHRHGHEWDDGISEDCEEL